MNFGTKRFLICIQISLSRFHAFQTYFCDDQNDANMFAKSEDGSSPPS